jgi:hypothetical protein
MTRVFLSTSYSTQINPKTGYISASFKDFIEQLTATLRDIDGIYVFCAVEDGDWVVSIEPPEVSIKKDLDEVRAADILVALIPPDVALGGVHFEMGVAFALGKKVLVATEPDTDIKFFKQGLVNAGYVHHVQYTSPNSLAEQIIQAT